MDFIVDKLTNSIENVKTGDSFATEISLLTRSDLMAVNKNDSWLFNWSEEYKHAAQEVYKLTILNNPSIIQGLISLIIKPDHVYINLLESAPFNKGDSKVYKGVPEILLPLHVVFLFRGGMKAMWPSFPRQN